MQHENKNDNELNEEQEAELNSNMGQLCTRVHDSLSDCEPYHQCAADFDAVVTALQQFYKNIATRDGKRVAALQLFSSSCTILAASIIENVHAMRDEPLEGDPQFGGATVAFLWEAMLQDVARIVHGMSDGGITLILEGKTHYHFNEGKPH